MKIIERVLGTLLMLGAVGHLIGSISAYRASPITLLWAVAASVLLALLGILTLLRVNRPADRTLAYVVAGGCLSWAALAIALGVVIHDLADPRVVVNAVLAVTVAGISVSARPPAARPRPRSR